ncbi:MAG: plastocyanin/azurin family copper-binding protein [Advenella sp.]
MNRQRRKLMLHGSGLWLAASFYPGLLLSENVVDIVMAGTVGGAHVWYDPYGLLIQAGQTVRWVNKDPGNTHTATAYHPDNYGRSRRIPLGAAAWNSGFLLPDESFSVTFEREGVYDFYCLPHEHAGMVGRIIVGKPDLQDWFGQENANKGVPMVALKAFPAVDKILQEKIVRV